MLCSIDIENVAIIEKTSILFKEGFNVLTGETGAGKSILIDSINMILGEKTSKAIIRNGENKAFVSAMFNNINENVKKKLLEINIVPDDEGCILLEKSIYLDGRSNCKINNKTVNNQTLKQVGNLLVNIHGQHDNQDILNEEKHIEYLDNFANNIKLKNDYETTYKKVLDIKKEIKSLSMDETLKEREIDLLKFQIEEISAAELYIGEEEELIKKKSELLNSKKIIDNVNIGYKEIFGDENQIGALDKLNSAAVSINMASKYSEQINPIKEKLDSFTYGLSDLVYEIKNYLDNFEASELNIDEIEERLILISKLKRKYGHSEEEILSYLDEIKAKLDNIILSDEKIESLKEKLSSEEKLLKDKAEKLSESRKNAALKLENLIVEQLKFLDMPNSVFKVNIIDDGYSSRGKDKVSFLISANLGQPPKPLSKIASGGELSRIMLAIKNITAQLDDVMTLIFDEIDTGISGRAAQKVGMKMKQVSKFRQIICVTHLAQIASNADVHFLIYKQNDENKTFTTVKELDYEGRVDEISRIIGGLKVNEATRNAAKDMILNNNI